ncbi:hypothetical protein AOLI_G00062400 [Acnodon oligacanthus]
MHGLHQTEKGEIPGGNRAVGQLLSLFLITPRICWDEEPKSQNDFRVDTQKYPQLILSSSLIISNDHV